MHWMKKNPSKQKAILITGSFASFYGSPFTNVYATVSPPVLRLLSPPTDGLPLVEACGMCPNSL